MSDISSLQMVHALADNAKENIFAAKNKKSDALPLLEEDSSSCRSQIEHDIPLLLKRKE